MVSVRSTIAVALTLLFLGGTRADAQTKPSSASRQDGMTKQSESRTVTKTSNVDDRVEKQAEAKKMSDDKGFPEYIGTGELHHDGTIVLRLTREDAGRRFHDELHYGPKDPNYKSILKHIGPVKENEIFSVKPFEDN